MGANPTRSIGRSAGSNQSAAGGNKCGEVLCVTVTSGDLATMQAETRVNAEQASKTDVAEADPSEFRGRPLPLGRIATAPNGSVGVMASACMEEEVVGTREAPTVIGRGSQLELREEKNGSFGVADRLVLLMKPGNAGGGKEPDFWRVTGRDQRPGDWLCLSTPLTAERSRKELY